MFVGFIDNFADYCVMEEENKLKDLEESTPIAEESAPVAEEEKSVATEEKPVVEEKAVEEPVAKAEPTEPTEAEAEAESETAESAESEAEPAKVRLTDADREENLKIKLQIIEELKVLIDKEETGGRTFQEFSNLQDRWKKTGDIPYKESDNVYRTYRLHVTNFRNKVKLNKELQELDRKHNYTEKSNLCEESERLAAMEDVKGAFKALQELHTKWKDIGPVAKEHEEELWERFKAATATINEKYHKFYDENRKEMEEALKLKEEICTKAAAIIESAYTSVKEWNDATEMILKLQQEWRDAGDVPLKERSKIYKKFRSSCDRFFDAKRDFFKDVVEEQSKNLELKIALCEKVEALQNSEDWKAATDAIIAAQKEWRAIGNVAQKHSQKIWKRFRTACDNFFNRKSEHFKNIDSEQSDNLVAKEAIIEELKKFELSDDPKGDLNRLQEIQSRWSAIGYVPLKKKEALQASFREAINTIFNKIDLPADDKELEKFRSKVNTYDENKDRNAYKIVGEREKLVSSIRQLESDIHTQENNMGFFSASKNAEGLLAGFAENIEKSKKRLALLREKLKELDKII